MKIENIDDIYRLIPETEIDEKFLKDLTDYTYAYYESKEKKTVIYKI
ncbi:MAG: hypothetical protein ACFFDB_00500 [Promethearchaeota archaeon]